MDHRLREAVGGGQGCDLPGWEQPVLPGVHTGHSALIPAQPGGFPGYDWDSTIQGPYQFWHALQWLTLGTSMQVYSDNHGQAMALIYGDDNLTFADCRIDLVTGTPVCEPGDVVGDTTVSAIADYPYFRKHRDIEGNDATITWEWAGYKRVTVNPVAGDPNHTYVVAHLLDRDGECIGENPFTAPKKWDGVGSDVRLEPVQFETSGDGVIIAMVLLTRCSSPKRWRMFWRARRRTTLVAFYRSRTLGARLSARPMC